MSLIDLRWAALNKTGIAAKSKVFFNSSFTQSDDGWWECRAAAAAAAAAFEDCHVNNPTWDRSVFNMVEQSRLYTHLCITLGQNRNVKPIKKGFALHLCLVCLAEVFVHTVVAYWKMGDQVQGLLLKGTFTGHWYRHRQKSVSCFSFSVTELGLPFGEQNVYFYYWLKE